ncbi:hypothetical protein IFM89_033617 [Coptis chinensis]|uniref:Uncharacterized protein n=1 Tax=Coptis chinensis TaxID=261450 RepID=A0A835IIN3_9MAGN|nr:hypothetical protein IFM89_033617 [Coptis chinensis]
MWKSIMASVSALQCEGFSLPTTPLKSLLLKQTPIYDNSEKPSCAGGTMRALSQVPMAHVAAQEYQAHATQKQHAHN